MKKRFMRMLPMLCILFALFPLVVFAEDAVSVAIGTSSVTDSGTEESIYGDSPVCGIAGADLSACVGEADLLMMQPRAAVQEVSNRTDLQNAITNATGDVSIKLSDAYTDTVGTLTIGNVAHNFTIDLNGKTLDGGSSGSAIVHSGTGTLTITDSSSSPGKVISANTNTTSGTINLNGGTASDTVLAVTGGTVENTARLGNAVYSYSVGIVNISGGKVSAPSGYAIYNNNVSTVNISGGEVSVAAGVAVYNFAAGAVNISGGTVSATDTDGNAVYNYVAGKITVSGTAKVTSGNNSISSGTIDLNGGTASDTVLAVTGGTVENTGSGIAVYNGAAGVVNISSGKVSAPSGYAIYNNNVSTVNISGGEVSVATGIAVFNFAAGAVNISGGMVSATDIDGKAVYNCVAGKITVSGTAKVTSGNNSIYSGTIQLNGGAATDTVLEITGGTVENTSTSGIAIYNAAVDDVKITVQVTDGSTAIVKGGGKAMSKAPTLVDTACEASTAKTDGSELGDYDSNAIASYKYLKFTRDARTPVVTPNATITATGADSGELSGLTASANYKYSTNGGTSYTDFTGATTTIASGITTTNGVWVVAKGNGTNTKDSMPQKITVTQATTPTVGKTDCTTAENNDGKITGVSTTMEYKLVTATGWTTIAGGDTVVGLANGTYNVRVKATGTTLASPNATVTIGAFVKRTPTTSDLSYSLTAVNYDGNPKPVSVTAQGGKNLGLITVKYDGKTTAPTNAGTYAITVDTAGSDDYEAATGLSLGNYTINKATYTGTTTVSTSVIVDGAVGATKTLPALPAGASYGTPVASGDVTMSDMSITDTTLTYTAPASTKGKTGIVTIPVTGATNYTEYDVVVTVTYTSKTAQEIAYANASIDKTYGDEKFINTLTQTIVNGDISYASDNHNVATVDATTGEITILAQGTATISATAAATATHDEATASYTLTVAKKSVTLQADHKTMNKGEAIPTLTYTATGLVNGDTMTTSPTLATTTDGTTAGTFDITIAGGVISNRDNYTITYQKGTLSVLDIIVASYTINASTGIGGTISPAGNTVVNAGESKSYTITPNSGYVIDSVIVDDVNKGAIQTYTFANINEDHTIFATFREEGQEPEDTYTYKIIDGANGVWKNTSSSPLVFKIDGDYDKFSAVEVDGNVIDKVNYTIEKGSTIVHLKSEYLKTLTVGKHEITFIFADHEAATTFHIKAVETTINKEDTKKEEQAKEDVLKNTASLRNNNIIFMNGLVILLMCGYVVIRSNSRKEKK